MVGDIPQISKIKGEPKDMPRKNKHTKDKKPSKHKKNTNSKNGDSIAGSMLREVAEQLGLDGLFDGKIVHVSFDCPLNLRKAFMREIKENGSSACKELQKFMASYVVVSRLKKHALGNTLSKLVDMPVVIENLSLNQYVQSRPRRHVRNVGFVKCEARGCGEPAEFRFHHYNGRVYNLCGRHVEEYREFAIKIERLRDNEAKA